MAQNWLLMVILSTIISIPIYLAVGFFSKNYHVKPDIFLIWYFLGVAIASTMLRESVFEVTTIPWKVIGSILLIGIILGGLGNILLFRSVAIAPNPGLATAIAGSASVGMYFLAWVLAKWFPAYFNEAIITTQSFIGLFFTILGITIIALGA